jgi:hypothetical protein
VKRTTTILALGALFLASSALAGNSTTSSRGPVRSCDDFDIRFDDEPAVVHSEVLTLAGSELTARPGENGGVWVYAEDRGDFSITVCRAAERSDLLPKIEVALRGTQLRIDGPSDDWVTQLIVKAPRHATLALSTTNGPISVRGLAGTLNATSLNGPITVKDSPGSIDAHAVNGPVHISGTAGIVRARTDNGPVSVVADGTDWDGEVDASTTNGPISLDLPDAFTGTAVVQSKGRSPVKCRHAACREGGARYWDEDGDPRIQIGTGNPVIRVSTSNGPVTVGSAKS